MNNKALAIGLIVGLVIGLIAGYGVTLPRIREMEGQVSVFQSKISELESQVAELQELMPRTLTIRDSLGRNVTIPYPLKKVVVINPSVAEIIRALNMTYTIVGVSGSIADNPAYWPELSGKTVVCEFAHSEPNYEAILALNETVGGIDAVIDYGTHPAVRSFFDEMAATLAPIPVIGIDCYKFETLYSDIETLGVMFGRKSAADELIVFFEEIFDLVENRTSGIPDEEKVPVYFESHGGEYYTGTGTSTLGKIIAKAGGKNIFGELRGPPYQEISPEDIIKNNPQVILKDTRGVLGYNVTDPTPIQAYLDEVYARAVRDGWNGVDAVAKNKTYLLSEYLVAGPKKCILVVYVAKMLYPELFADVDAEAFLQEYFERFQHVPYLGIFVYPSPW